MKTSNVSSADSAMNSANESLGSIPCLAESASQGEVVKPGRDSLYEPVILHRLATNCTWGEACIACNLEKDKWPSAQQRYLKYAAYYDSLLEFHIAEQKQCLVFSEQRAIESLSLVINQYINEWRMNPLPSNPDLERVKRDNVMATTFERLIAIGKALKMDSPFVADAKANVIA